MNAVQTIAAFLAAIGGLGGLATSLRARAQNRLDASASHRTDAEAESIAVDTARGLIAEVREEMDRRVSELDREVRRLRDRLETALDERDRFRDEAEGLHALNRDLQRQVAGLRERLRDVTAALVRERARREAGEASPPA